MGEWLQVGEANRAYLAVPDSGSGPGVLVLHAWWGLTPVFTDVCDRLAAAGFVALAPSLYADDATATTIAEAETLRDTHDEAAEAEPVAQAAVEQLLGLPEVVGTQIGVIGFSLGAYWALHLSQVRPDDVSAVVVFYGTDDGDYRTARAAYLGHFAEHDDFEPLEAVRAGGQNQRGGPRRNLPCLSRHRPLVLRAQPARGVRRPSSGASLRAHAGLLERTRGLTGYELSNS